MQVITDLGHTNRTMIDASAFPSAGVMKRSRKGLAGKSTTPIERHAKWPVGKSPHDLRDAPAQTKGGKERGNQSPLQVFQSYLSWI